MYRINTDTLLTHNKSNLIRLERVAPPDQTVQTPQPVQVAAKPRLFDDIMTATKTFTPLLSVLIPLYFHKKSKDKIAQTVTKHKVQNVNQKRRNRNS